nr:proteoglycan 4 [Drosophila suzukii]
MLRPRCLVSFVGLCLVISLGMRCDARAVNVSNTWTMPQEGLNVFYRFFRDRISWFEADAVCQFHHANLVTVDNSFQFDATRDLLRELDVNDIVWIGLMRPQNSDRFMWSNSRPLVADTGYWAESLPLMDAPLCAVIDPIRDYRWHALRCGGPETASFLCEMPVPSWADACILKDMPNLTMQYMADTASIELIRNCQEEGLLRHTCKGKEDREPAIRQLICPKERLEAQRINDITNSHFKSLQIINNIRTDNKENNDIDLLPNYGRRSGMAINIEVAPPVPPVSVSVPGLGELMQADAPGAVSLSGLYRIPDLVPKPVKKAAKKVITPDFAKKLQGSQQQQHSQQQQQQQKSRKSLVHQHEEEMMMGDQPALSEEQLPPGMDVGMHIPLNEDDSNSDASNEIFEHLPHKKKILPQDLRTMSPIVEADVPLTTAATTILKTTTLASPATATATTTAATTTTTTTAKATATTTTAEVATTPKAVDTTSSQVPTATTTRGSTTTIRTTTITTTTTTTTTPRPEETTTTTTRKPEPTTMVAPRTTKAAAAAATSSMASTTTTTTTTTSAATPTTTTASHATPTDNSNNNMAHPIHPSQQQQHHQQQILHEGSTLQQQHATHVNESADNTRFIPPMLLVKSHYVPPAKHASEHATTTTLAATTTSTVTTAAAAATTTSAKAESQPSAVTSSKELTAATATPATPATTAAANAVATSTVTATTGAAVEMTTSVKVAEDTAATSATTAAAAAVIASEAPAATTIAVRPTAGNEIKSNATAATPKATAATTTTTTTTKRPVPRPVRFTKYPENVGSFKVDNNGMGSPEEEDDQDELGHLDTEAATKRHNFLEETEAPFKPNRRRSLTKPETVSYFKKILG